LGCQFSPERIAQTGVSIVTTVGPVMQVRSNGAQLVEIGSMIDVGQVRVAIDTVVPLAEEAKAHEHSAAGHMRGKIVLAV